MSGRRRVALAAALLLVPAACGDGDGGAGAASDAAFLRFDGGEGSLADYAGTPLVLNFWASWCPPCVRELPALEQVSQDLAGDVAFLGMNVTDDRASAVALAEEAGVTYDLAEDPDGELFTSLAGVNMPTTVFIDADGEVVGTHEGAFDSAADLHEIVAEMFPDATA